MVFGVMDFGRLFYAYATVQHAVREAGRFAVTGSAMPDPNSPRVSLSRVQSIEQVARAAAQGQRITEVAVSSRGRGRNNAGGPGDLVTVSITCDLELMTPLVAKFFPNGRFTFRSSTTFRNEPFNARAAG